MRNSLKRNLFILLFLSYSTLSFSQTLLTYQVVISSEYNLAKRQQILAVINSHRKTNGVHALTYNEELESAAKIQALYLKEKQIIDHYNPTYPQPWDRMKAVNPNAKVEASGEILTVIWKLDKAAVDNALKGRPFKQEPNMDKYAFIKFKQSKDHNQLMLDRDFDYMGAYAVYDRNTGFWGYAIVFGWDK